MGSVPTFLPPITLLVSCTVEVGKDKIEWWTKETSEGLELIAVNTADHPVEAEIAVPGGDRLRHLFRRYEVWRTRLPRNAYLSPGGFRVN